MNIKYILLLVLVFPMLSSCHEEDKLTPASTEMDLRFEFPEGDNPWDQDILEIVDKFSTYLIYKNLTKEDFNHTWQSVMGSYGGEPLYEFYKKSCIRIFETGTCKTGIANLYLSGI